MKARFVTALALAAGVLLVAQARAQDAAPAVPDTSLGGYLNAMSDSTDRYFGLSAAPVDTAGLDTVLAQHVTRKHFDLSGMPTYNFSRVTGNDWGAWVAVEDLSGGERQTGLGKLKGSLSYAAGLDTWMGMVEYTNRVWVSRLPFDLRVGGGRRVRSLNGDDFEPRLNLLRAIFTGEDFSNYYRADGFEGSVRFEATSWRVGAGYADWLQSPLPVTTTWTLSSGGPHLMSNFPAEFGRAREIRLEGGLHLTRLPMHAEASWARSNAGIGSDFEYDRWRAAAGFDLSLGHVASFLPQFAYGRLTGQDPPQDAFYLGSRSTLRSLQRDAIGGTGQAVGKLELIAAQDLLTLMQLRSSALLPLRLELFVETAAVWGPDPYTGEIRRGVDWPDRSLWQPEAGASLLYGSVLFDEKSFLRLSYAYPLGPENGRSGTWSLAYSRGLDLLSPWASRN